MELLTTNNVWMMVCTFLVFFMHLGFTFLEIGLTRQKNSINILFKNFFVITAGLIIYCAIGFNLMYPSEWIIEGILGADLIKEDHNIVNQNHSPYKERIEIVERLTDHDAIIATGSNNSSRYFEHYFGNYPNIIRKNRTSIALLDGKESKAQLEALGNDIFRYFGLGCRNISKIYVPQDYKLDPIFEAVASFEPIMHNNKYKNNYDYKKISIVFGCGGDRDRGKRAKMGHIAQKYADNIILTSDNPRTENPRQILDDIMDGITTQDALTIEEDRAIAIHEAISLALPGDIVLIAGKGHEDYQILGEETIKFDDREISSLTYLSIDHVLGFSRSD